MGKKNQSNPKKPLWEENLSSLLAVNTDKMNFQQNMCFQMQNWAIGITAAIIGFSWKMEDHSIFIIAHIVLLFTLGLFIWERSNWMLYFFVFQERVRLTERCILGRELDEIEGHEKTLKKDQDYYYRYYYYSGKEYNQLHKSKIINFICGGEVSKNKVKRKIILKIGFNKFYLFLVTMTILSLLYYVCTYCIAFNWILRIKN
ncbi:DUF2270 domain-containing protein [Saccharicrinis sp. 156]|uniref:DUF2270 domain-containing protein n=1 Tax=Saccharicrinis sp. 156 TaxID=3417574 RepID=UPI003D33B1F6